MFRSLRRVTLPGSFAALIFPRSLSYDRVRMSFGQRGRFEMCQVRYAKGGVRVVFMYGMYEASAFWVIETRNDCTTWDTIRDVSGGVGV